MRTRSSPACRLRGRAGLPGPVDGHRRREHVDPLFRDQPSIGIRARPGSTVRSCIRGPLAVRAPLPPPTVGDVGCKLWRDLLIVMLTIAVIDPERWCVL